MVEKSDSKKSHESWNILEELPDPETEIHFDIPDLIKYYKESVNVKR
jgi:hypothetical protein